MFKFSNEKRVLMVYHYGQKKDFTISKELIIQRGEGLPANSTIIPPPKFGAYTIPVFESEKWVVYPDFRGQKAWPKKINAEDFEYDIEELGEVPTTHTLIEPPGQNYEFNDTTGEWEAANLEEVYGRMGGTPWAPTAPL